LTTPVSLHQDLCSGINERTTAFIYRSAGPRIAKWHRFADTGIRDFQRGRCVLSKVLRLTLSVRIFEQLAAEADAENIPNAELARRYIASRYEKNAAIAGSTGAAQRPRPLEKQFPSRLIREAEAIFGNAIDAYGRIVQALEMVFTTPERRAKIGNDLKIVGNGTALLRELLDQLETLRPTCRPPRGGSRRPIPDAANDDLPE
jgi:hypothetical protein